MELHPGLTARLTATVSAEDTAIALGSGTVEVLGTPRALALMEAATLRALEGSIDAGVTSVGARVELDHLAPSQVGASVEVIAELIAVDGRKLVFDAEIRDGGVIAAKARIIRVLVATDSFARTPVAHSDPLVGASHTDVVIVGPGDTAFAARPEMDPIVSSTRLLEWIELACVKAVDKQLPDGVITVGAHAEIDHLRPATEGTELTVTATVAGAGRRKLAFSGQVSAAGELIATASIIRVRVATRESNL